MYPFKKMCEPAKLYLVVSMIFLVMAIFTRISALTLLIKGVFVLIWTMVLNWLCSKGFSGLAWIIVLLPFLFLFMAMFTTMDMMGHEGFQSFFSKEYWSPGGTASKNVSTARNYIATGFYDSTKQKKSSGSSGGYNSLSPTGQRGNQSSAKNAAIFAISTGK